jgi:hypothetical protein
MAPIFTGPPGVGVGVAVGVAVAVAVGMAVAVAVGVGVAVGTTVAVDVGDRVGVSSSFPLPQAASTDSINTRARTTAVNLHQRPSFQHMLSLLLQCDLSSIAV